MGKVLSRFVMSNGSSHAKLEINSTEVLAAATVLLSQPIMLWNCMCKLCSSAAGGLQSTDGGGAEIGMKQNTNNNNAGCLQFHLLMSIDIYTGTRSTCNKPRPSWFYSSPECGLSGELLFHSDVNDVKSYTTSGDIRLIANSWKKLSNS